MRSDPLIRTSAPLRHYRAESRTLHRAQILLVLHQLELVRTGIPHRHCWSLKMPHRSHQTPTRRHVIGIGGHECNIKSDSMDGLAHAYREHAPARVADRVLHGHGSNPASTPTLGETRADIFWRHEMGIGGEVPWRADARPEDLLMSVCVAITTKNTTPTNACVTLKREAISPRAHSSFTRIAQFFVSAPKT